MNKKWGGFNKNYGNGEDLKRPTWLKITLWSESLTPCLYVPSFPHQITLNLLSALTSLCECIVAFSPIFFHFKTPWLFLTFLELESPQSFRLTTNKEFEFMKAAKWNVPSDDSASLMFSVPITSLAEEPSDPHEPSFFYFFIFPCETRCIPVTASRQHYQVK